MFSDYSKAKKTRKFVLAMNSIASQIDIKETRKYNDMNDEQRYIQKPSAKCQRSLRRKTYMLLMQKMPTFH